MTDFHYNTDNILCNFPSSLRKSIEELCLKSQIGLSSVSLNDISILSNRYQDEENPLSNYHFIIKIPYAGKRLIWEVIFDPEDFSFAPDFDFNDDQFLNCPDYDILANNIPTLVEWDSKNPKALSQVLNEFLSLYKKLQIERLLQDNIYSRYSEEYQALVTSEVVAAEDVEILIDTMTIHFLISLRVDCSALPEYLQYPDSEPSVWYNPGEDFAHLRISILKLDGTRCNIALQLSPRLEQVLGNSKNVLLPDFKRDTLLIEYVAKVSVLIDEHIDTIVNQFKLKKIYVTTLAAACSSSVIEYDTESYQKVVLLYSVKDYSCLITVTIGTKFPQEKPVVQLHSIFCKEGKQCTERVDKYPYNSTYQPDDNIEMLLEYIPEAILKFKNHKH